MVGGMELPRFAVVDLETTGLRTDRHRIVQLAMVTVDAEGSVHDSWDSFVRLRWPLASVGPTDIHGITRSMLRGAPKLRAVVDEFADRLGDSMLVAHNARFDGEFLVRAATQRRRSSRDDLPSKFERRLCTLRMSRRLDPDRRLSHRLGDVCARYDVPLDHAHDARCDALATAAVLPHLLRAHDVTGVADLEPFLDRPRL